MRRSLPRWRGPVLASVGATLPLAPQSVCGRTRDPGVAVGGANSGDGEHFFGKSRLGALVHNAGAELLEHLSGARSQRASALLVASPAAPIREIEVRARQLCLRSAHLACAALAPRGPLDRRRRPTG